MCEYLFANTIWIKDDWIFDIYLYMLCNSAIIGCWITNLARDLFQMVATLMR